MDSTTNRYRYGPGQSYGEPLNLKEVPKRRLILGGGMVGTHAGDMNGEIALAIEMRAVVVDIGKTIQLHATLGESIDMATEIAHGTCTDVPPLQISVSVRVR